MEFQLRGLRISEETNDRLRMAYINESIAIIHHEQGEFGQALEFYGKGLRIYEEVKADKDVGRILSNIGDLHFRRGEYADAMRQYQRGITIQQEIGATMDEAATRNNIGDAHRALREYDQAIDQYQQALHLMEPGGDDRVVADALSGLAATHLALHDHQRAITYGERGLVFARKVEWTHTMRDVSRTLYLCYKATGRPAKALAMYETHIALRDSLMNEENQRAIVQQRLQYEYETKEALLNAEHAQEQALAASQTAEERRQKRSALIVGGMFVLVACLLLFLLLKLRNQHMRVTRAQQQVVEAEIAAKDEQVRTRIARDIHDEIGSGLTKIALLGSEARQRMQEHSEELRSTLERIIGHSREVNAALSDIVWSVDPAHDTSEELVHHARNVAQRLLEGSGVAHELRFDHIDPAHPVAPGTKHHVVMVMKEAINNALKYAEARHITIQLEAGAHRVKLVVHDDGRGFDPEAMARAGNGLRNMRARAESIGADLRMESAPGKGCTIALAGKLA